MCHTPMTLVVILGARSSSACRSAATRSLPGVWPCLLLLAAATLGLAPQPCAATSGCTALNSPAAGVAKPLAILGRSDSGASALLGAMPCLVTAAPRAEFRKAGLGSFAAAVLQASGGIRNYSVSSLPLMLATDVALRVCQFRTSSGVVAAVAAQRPLWGWHSPESTAFLPFLVDVFPDLRVLLVTRSPLGTKEDGATATQHWAAEQLEVLSWIHLHAPMVQMYHVRMEELLYGDIAARTAALRPLLAWLGGASDDNDISAHNVLLELALNVEFMDAPLLPHAPVDDAHVRVALNALGYAPARTAGASPPVAGLLELQRAALPPRASARLAAITAGAGSRGELEVVLCRYSEDPGWAVHAGLASVLSVYNLGEPLPAHTAAALASSRVVQLPNRGRENAAYLYHIVHNYDTLADVTVFSHAGLPTSGMRSANGGGHMLPGTTIFDYALASPETGFFQFTTAISMRSLRRVRRRLGARARPKGCVDREAATSPAACLVASDVVELARTPIFENHVARLCRRQRAHICSISEFWDAFLIAARPPDDVVYFAQGARFAVTRAQLHRRPRAQYEQLLATVNGSVDPSAGYFLECLWYYVLTSPGSNAPCEIQPYLLH